MSALADDEIVLGEIVGIFGFRGELRLMLHNREGDTLSEPRDVTLVLPGGERRDVHLSARTGAGKRVLGRIAGVASEEAARALVGAHVLIRRSLLPQAREGEFYLHDILGLPVEDEAGEPLGTLADVVAGEKDVWVLELADGGEGFLLATPDAVRSVDVAAGRIVVTRSSVTLGD